MAVIQEVKFRPKQGVDPQEFSNVNERFQREVAPALPGLERREASLSADGEWLLVLRYADMAAATAGPKADAGNEVAGMFMQMIDPSTMSMALYEIVSE